MNTSFCWYYILWYYIFYEKSLKHLKIYCYTDMCKKIYIEKIINFGHFGGSSVNVCRQN